MTLLSVTLDKRSRRGDSVRGTGFDPPRSLIPRSGMKIYLTLASDPDGPCVAAGCRGGHPTRLWVVTRRGEAWGHFAVASLNGKRQVIDGSLPTEVTKVPRGARELSPEGVARCWHHDNESHVFGGPNTAMALRAVIKATNEGRAPDIRPCPLCGDPLDLNGTDAAHSYTVDDLVHRDCLIDSGEVG